MGDDVRDDRSLWDTSLHVNVIQRAFNELVVRLMVGFWPWSGSRSLGASTGFLLLGWFRGSRGSSSRACRSFLRWLRRSCRSSSWFRGFRHFGCFRCGFFWKCQKLKGDEKKDFSAAVFDLQNLSSLICVEKKPLFLWYHFLNNYFEGGIFFVKRSRSFFEYLVSYSYFLLLTHVRHCRFFSFFMERDIRCDLRRVLSSYGTVVNQFFFFFFWCKIKYTSA